MYQFILLVDYLMSRKYLMSRNVNKLAIIIKEFENENAKKIFNLKLNQKVLLRSYSGWQRQHKATLKFKVIDEEGNIKNAYVSQIKVLPKELQNQDEINKFINIQKENIRKLHEEQYFPIIGKVLKFDENYKLYQIIDTNNIIYWLSLRSIPLIKLEDLESSYIKQEYISINIPLWLYKKTFGNPKYR